MESKPALFGAEYATAFQEADVVRTYQYRPPYPDALFDLLMELLPGEPRGVLDIGCGTGALARRLAPLVERVDAVDISPAMLEEGRRLPGGDHPGINWILGRVEDVALHRPYGLVTAGASLHWMEWETVLPRLQDVLVGEGRLAIVEDGQLPLPWDGELREIIKRYSVYGRWYDRPDLIGELERRGLFRCEERRRVGPMRFVQPVSDYVESFHARAGLPRARMGADSAAAFDAEVHALVSAQVREMVAIEVVAGVAWGRPTRP
ncbi:MAG: class I SAM-dependent methyltransferase [Dehalococcoidia bacterium]